MFFPKILYDMAAEPVGLWEHSFWNKHVAVKDFFFFKLHSFAVATENRDGQMDLYDYIYIAT